MNIFEKYNTIVDSINNSISILEKAKQNELNDMKQLFGFNIIICLWNERYIHIRVLNYKNDVVAVIIVNHESKTLYTNIFGSLRNKKTGMIKITNMLLEMFPNIINVSSKY